MYCLLHPSKNSKAFADEHTCCEKTIRAAAELYTKIATEGPCKRDIKSEIHTFCAGKCQAVLFFMALIYSEEVPTRYKTAGKLNAVSSYQLRIRINRIALSCTE